MRDGGYIVGMSLLEASAVETFAHQLAEPVATYDFADIAARTGRMTAATDAVMKRFAPSGDEALDAKHLKVVEGLVALISGGITDYAKLAAAVEDNNLHSAMVDAHNAMVDDYYRLLTLRADLDPESRGIDRVLSSPEEIDAWFDEIVRG
jgi:hypothetical protein